MNKITSTVAATTAHVTSNSPTNRFAPRLSLELALAVHHLYGLGRTKAFIAEAFDVYPSTITAIVNGRSYAGSHPGSRGSTSKVIALGPLLDPSDFVGSSAPALN